MIKSYLTIALRNLFRNKVFTTINIVGLSIGFACSMLIILYVNDEMSFDKFHKNAPQLYRVVSAMTHPDGLHKNSRQGLPVGPALKADLPGIQESVRSVKKNAIVKLKNEAINEPIYYNDENFFSVFSFPLVHGSSASVLKQINSVVLSRDKAIQYFGTEDAVGKELSMKVDSTFDNFVVTGVAENVPQNSSIQFDFVLPISKLKKGPQSANWMSFNVSTFVLLQPGMDPEKVGSQMPAIVDKYLGERLGKRSQHTDTKATLAYSLQNIKDMHLDTSFTDQGGLNTSDPVYSYILMGISLFILAISCINFINLSVGLSIKRAKEIGVRKVVGGIRKQLILQFISESFLLCFFAFLLAWGLVEISLPLFNQLSNKQLSLSYVYNDPVTIISFVVLLLITSLAAGYYPAFIVSAFKPADVLYSKLQFAGKNIFSKYLVVVQFGLAIFLITVTLIFQSQFNLLINKDLGYTDKNIVRLSFPLAEQKSEIFKNELLKNNTIVEVTNRSGGLFIDGASANDRDIGTAILKADKNYLHFLNIPVLKGRDFSAGFPSDTADAVIVNEAFVKEIGWKDNPVGKKVSVSGNDVTVVGVVRDYNFQSLHDKIMPLTIHCGAISQSMDEALIKIKPDEIPRTLAYIENTFKKISLFDPFQYSFLEQDHAFEYNSEQKWKGILSNAAVLSVLISCLGLFGLTCLSIVRRTKEIGIRKILGASTSIITLLVLKDFMKLVIIAFLISIPFAWYSADKWLQNFPYRVNIEWWMFMIAGIAAIVVAVLTVSFQAIRAALSNPVNSLRSE